MSFMVVCDQCGLIAYVLPCESGEAVNPVNTKTGERWWSRVVPASAKENEPLRKTLHACSRECRDALGGRVGPF